MKKIYILLIIVLLVSGCSNKYKDWNTVKISDVGSFKIPQNMMSIEENETICLIDCKNKNEEDVQPLLIGVVYEKDYLKMLSKVLGKEIVYEELLESKVFANSATVGKHKYTIDGESNEVIFFRFIFI